MALAASRAAGVPSVAIQHGILYPKYYSYRHDADEADCPRPDRTALFGEAAKQFLVERGRYSPESLVLTGSPKFDEIARTTREWDRPALRERLGVAAGERLIVVASRFRGIVGYQSIGSAFVALVRAVQAPGNVRCIVKPHPAENPDAYLAVLRETVSSRTRLAPTDMSLLEMLHAGDALVTVESLSAVEALAWAGRCSCSTCRRTCASWWTRVWRWAFPRAKTQHPRSRRCSSTHRLRRASRALASATCPAWPAASTAAPPNGS